MALSHPSSPELKRHTFFVSRQREEGRERFRLHMGYFATQDEAEALLAAVRDVYPAAWAGPAPSSGLNRRARVSAAPVKAVSVAPAPVVEAAPVEAIVPPAAPVAEVPAPAPVVAAAPQVIAAPQPVAAPVVAAAPAVPAPQPLPTRVQAEDDPLQQTMSNVRAVLAHLSEESPAPPRDVPVVKPVARTEPPRLQPVVAPLAAPVAAPAAAPAAPDLSASQTLRLLEEQDDALETTQDAEQPEVRLVTPEDTQTLTDIRLDAQNNAPPCFAVQLIWSVSPIDVNALPHLAIFDAYTLYNVEGSRQGRKWYGLRLGFFSDPNSASQVAQYVRSDYTTVAVVPVAVKERDRARGGAPEDRAPAARVGAPATPARVDVPAAARDNLDGFELLLDDTPTPVKRDLEDVPTAKPVAAKPAAKAAPRAASAAPAPVPGKPQPPKAAGKPTGKRVVVRKRPDVPMQGAAPGAPQPLESTLEILGASTLTIDEGREIINDSVVRKPVAAARKAGGNRFSKLLSRLSGGA